MILSQRDDRRPTYICGLFVRKISCTKTAVLGNFEKRDLFHCAGFRTKILALGVFEVRFGQKQLLPAMPR